MLGTEGHFDTIPVRSMTRAGRTAARVPINIVEREDNGKQIALDRRTFVAGSAVAAATVGLGLYGCGGGDDTAATTDGHGARSKAAP